MGVYSTAVLADSPIHYWRCFENFGAQALQDIGLHTSYLYGQASQETGGGAGTSPIAALGWSGPASDGGSLCMVGTGFYNFIPTSGIFPDPPGVSFPIPGSLECWFWGGVPNSGASIQWFFPSQPAGEQFIAISMAFDRMQAQIFGGIFVTANVSWSSTWYHLVMTLTSTVCQFFVNGSSVGTAAVSLSNNPNATNFVVGQSGITNITLPQSGFVSEIAMYNQALGAGQVANHFAAGDSRTNSPTFYGIRPATVTSPSSYALGPAHLGLTGTGSISLAGGTVAALISVTTDTPEHGMIAGNPDYLLSRGYVNASNALGTVYQFDRLVFGTQVRELPRFTSLISWSFPPNLVVSITELFVR